MNVKSMLVGFLIAVVASTGTYFLLPPPSRAIADNQMDINDLVEGYFSNSRVLEKFYEAVIDIHRRLDGIENALFKEQPTGIDQRLA